MLSLPNRPGTKPWTSPTNPHQQLDQNPPAEIYALLKERAFDFLHVERRPSQISVPGAEALWLTEEKGPHRGDAFMIGKEFAHVHPPYDGSMHMALSQEDGREVSDKGWGELHPMVLRGDIQTNTVLVYGPRDEAELDVIMQILSASYRFARGE
ncbi:MAG: hypothetical protein ACE5JS_09895 [Nitrospinota bacterium]